MLQETSEHFLVTNEEVRNRIQKAIGVHDDLFTMVQKRKLRWYGHISRSSGMAKTILQGTVKGARKRGRQTYKWEDNIKEWTGMGFGESIRAAEDRERWKGIVATSSVVPRRPPRLRDWDEMREMTNGHRFVEAYDTDRYQWQPGHHWWPMVVSAAEWRSPNARVDSAPCWRGAASTIEQLKWFRGFSHQNAEYSFVLLAVTCRPLVNMQIFGT